MDLTGLPTFEQWHIAEGFYKLDVFKVIDGVDGPALEYELCLVGLDQEPTEADWQTPVADPDGGDAVGVAVGPTAGPCDLLLCWRVPGTTVEKPAARAGLFRLT